MVKRIVPGALALTLTLVGCPAGKDPKPDSGELSLADFCASGPDHARLDFSCLNGDPSLVSSTEVIAAQACAVVEAAVATGTVVYRGDLAKACADAWKTATCDTLLAVVWACLDSEIFAGTLPNGSACRDDLQCANGYCRMEATCNGVCTPYVGLDADCSAAGAECAPHQYCGSAGRCVALPTPSAQQGQTCVRGSCAPGLYCDPATSTCATTKKSGSCAGASDACAFGYACVESGTCVAYAGRGERCGRDAMCGPGWACIEGTCGPAPAIGNPCGSRYGIECAEGAYCDSSTTPTCRALKAGGAACTLSTECESRACLAGQCEPEPTVCVP